MNDLLFYPKKEIVNNLWVGSARDARDKDFLKQCGLVVNCSKTIPFAVSTKPSFRISVDDHPSENQKMLRCFPTAVRAIDDALLQERVVLVHCFAGMQRSAAVAAAYLMYKLGLKPEEAMKSIQRIKPEAFTPEATFLPALKQWYYSI